MNAAVERILKEFETTHAFGSAEVIFCNGVAVTVHVKKTHKLSSSTPVNTQRENRGFENGNQQHQNENR
jgi:hypothetical protein